MNSTNRRGVLAFVMLVGVASFCIIAAIHAAAAAGSSLVQTGDGARRITPDEVRALLKDHKAVLVDVRGKETYDAGHIKGALSIPFAEVEARAKELPHDKTIVTYCS